ncbi:MAG: hypothetical protein MJD61_08620 [Proteobacteria bacterium]|nr:hypothetical protein [Pseudomonadota bacterium]
MQRSGSKTRLGTSSGAVALASGLLWAAMALAEEPQGPGPMPSYKGRGKVTEAIGQAGALMDIGGATLRLPPRLRIGHSRVLTFRRVKKKIKPAQIHKRFVRIGPTLHFDGALDARGRPVSVTVKAKVKLKAGYKLVLAVEEAGICQEHNKSYKLGASGLCSAWRFEPARYRRGLKTVSASLESTGGYHLQFGMLPKDG